MPEHLLLILFKKMVLAQKKAIKNLKNLRSTGICEKIMTV